MAKAGVAYGSADLTTSLRRDVVMTSPFDSRHSPHGLFTLITVISKLFDNDKLSLAHSHRSLLLLGVLVN